MMRNETELTLPITIILEQDDTLLAPLLDILNQRQIPTIAVQSERELLNQLERYSKAILVLGSQLPTISTFDLVANIRRQYDAWCIPIIVLTEVAWSNSQKEAAVRGHALLDLLVKPIDPALVAERVCQGMRSLFDNFITEGPGIVRQDPPISVGDDENRTPLGVAMLAPPSTADPQRVSANNTGAPISTAIPISPAKGEPPFPIGQFPSRVQHPNPLSRITDDPNQHTSSLPRRAIEVLKTEFQGHLGIIAFPRLLNSLYRRHATGALFLMNKQCKKIAYFKEGQPTHIKSNLVSECLGTVLVDDGLITKSQFKESLRRMHRTGQQQGAILIEMGAITKRQMVIGLERQIHLKLMEIFKWSDGDFIFRGMLEIPNEPITFNISTPLIIAEGIRHNWDELRLKQTLDGFLDRYIIPTLIPELRFQELCLSEEEQSFLDNIEGTQTLRQLLSNTPLPMHKALAAACIFLLPEFWKRKCSLYNSNHLD